VRKVTVAPYGEILIAAVNCLANRLPDAATSVYQLRGPIVYEIPVMVRKSTVQDRETGAPLPSPKWVNRYRAPAAMSALKSGTVKTDLIRCPV
jgi:hypothetical protein